MKSICFLLIIISLGCASSKQHNAAAPKKIKKGLIEMSKTVCFGKCPAYKITINEKGEVNYEGQRNVEKIGNYKKQLTPSATDSLFTEFINSDFWAFKDEYTAMVTDLPTTYLSFTLEEKTKKITDYVGAPEKLKMLEGFVEQIANSNEGWEKINTGN
jgi:hypothetical protein